ncbi:MAG: response regulator [Magnetococcales bacterium]|nr:response regulator [Magnetococcales bacterium]
MASILLVEDSKSFASFLTKQIESRLNIQVELARTLAETKIIVGQSPERFFLSILDLNLPDAPNGEVVDFVRVRKIPSIVLTGEYKKELRDQIISRGVLDYFIKDNISVVDSVLFFVQRLVKNRQSHVLVVDDSRSFRSMLVGFLREYGFTVLEAADGEQALGILDAHPVRLVLTDYQMPNMDGFQLTKRIRAKFPRDHVAVIGLSSQGSTDLAAQFIKAGANDFLTKPFQNEELFCRVSQNIAIIESHEDLEQQVQERTRRLAETLERLKSRENYLQSILETALDGIVSTDAEGRVIHFNPAAERLFGFKKAQLLQQQISKIIIPEEYRERHCTGLQAYAALPAEQRPRLHRRIEYPGLRADGARIDLEIALTAAETEGNLFFTAFIHDVTERKQLVKSLEETLAVAESANRAKSEFLANMSHEIRTPMNAIIGMTDLVLSSELNDEQRENLEIVQRSSQSLLELINSILDLSKIEAGRLKLERIPFDLLGRMETACETLAVKAHQQDLELICQVHPDLPETLVGDPLRLNQVVINLLNNAIKFTKNGEITLSVSMEPAPEHPEEGQQQLRFSVRDTGIGIPVDRLAQVFERFTQVDGSTTRKFGGTGLGLTISRHLVEMMGGRIWVESEVGRGSVFHFTSSFPVGKRHKTDLQGSLEERSERPRETPLGGVRVLVATLNASLRAHLVDVVAYFGGEAQQAGDAATLTALLESAREKPFDVVVMDHVFVEGEGRLPEGFAAHPGWRRKGLLLLPASRRFEDLRPTIAFEEVAGLRKPPRRFQVLRMINKLLGRLPEEKAAEPVPAPSVVVANPLDILLVEDNENNQRLAITILERCGHRITVANNGREGLERLATMPFCDVIIMDLQMPEMGGYEATQQIRQNTGLGDKQQVHIIACTAHAYEAERQRCLDEGMNDFLRKPYRPQELLELLQPLMVRKAAARPAMVRTGPVKSPLVAVNDPPEVLAANRSRFLEEGGAQLEMLRKVLENRDPTAARKLAEGLQEMAVKVGAQRVKVRAMFLGRKAEMKIWDEAQNLFAELQNEYVQAVEAMKGE